MDERSITTPKQEGGVTRKGFVKGDPRINRKGRPRTSKEVQDLAQAIAHEVATDKDGNPIIWDGHKVTVGEMILRSWAKNPRMQEKFVERAFGKVPQTMDLSVMQKEVKAADLTDDELAAIAASRRSGSRDIETP